MYDWILNAPLDGFVQNASSIATIVECLATTAWQKYHQ